MIGFSIDNQPHSQPQLQKKKRTLRVPRRRAAMGSSLTAETVFVGAFIAILLCLFAYRARTTSSADHHGREGGEDPQASASKGTNYMRVVEDIVMSPSCLFGSTLVAALLAASYRRFLQPSPASAASSLMQREASFSEPSSSLATASALETGSAVSAAAASCR